MLEVCSKAVETIINQPARETRRHIGDLFHRRKRYDLLPLYFLGHGLLDEAGQLFLAAVDTGLDSLAETAILAAYITDRMDRSFSRHPVKLKPRKWTYSERYRFIIARNPKNVEPERLIKWDLIFGAIMTPTATIVIGGQADLSAAVGLTGMFLLFYAWLY